MFILFAGCDGNELRTASPSANDSKQSVSGPAPDSPPDATSAKDPILAVLPDFELTDQDRQTFGARQLYKKAWIATFIFTRCTATCPRQTEKMAELQQRLQKHAVWNDIRLVSFSVDPENDTPDVLRAYADRAGADPQHWKFLTGSRDEVWQLCRNGFKLPVGEDDNAAMPIFHSPVFVLVDPYLRVRGILRGVIGGWSDTNSARS